MISATSYPYRPPSTPSLVIVIIMIFVTLVFVIFAISRWLSNVSAYGTGEPPYYCIFICIICAVKIQNIISVQQLRNVGNLVIGEDAIEFPWGFGLLSKALIPFDDIQRLETERFFNSEQLHIITTDGKYTILASCLPSQDVYRSLKSTLFEKSKITV